MAALYVATAIVVTTVNALYKEPTVAVTTPRVPASLSYVWADMPCHYDEDGTHHCPMTKVYTTGGKDQ